MATATVTRADVEGVPADVNEPIEPLSQPAGAAPVDTPEKRTLKANVVQKDKEIGALHYKVGTLEEELLKSSTTLVIHT